MTAEDYLKKFKDGYPSNSKHLKGLTKKEINAKIGKHSFMRDEAIHGVARYNSGLAALEKHFKEKKIHDAKAEFDTRKENLYLAFNTSGFDHIRFGFLNSEIDQVTLMLNIEELGTKKSSGLVGVQASKALKGSFERDLGQELARRTIKASASNERINILAVHTNIDGEENVISMLFEYSEVNQIEKFFAEHYSDKFLLINVNES